MQTEIKTEKVSSMNVDEGQMNGRAIKIEPETENFKQVRSNLCQMESDIIIPFGQEIHFFVLTSLTTG